MIGKNFTGNLWTEVMEYKAHRSSEGSTEKAAHNTAKMLKMYLRIIINYLYECGYWL